MDKRFSSNKNRKFGYKIIIVTWFDAEKSGISIKKYLLIDNRALQSGEFGWRERFLIELDTYQQRCYWHYIIHNKNETWPIDFLMYFLRRSDQKNF